MQQTKWPLTTNSCFWLFCLLHTIIWTAVPGLVNSNTPLDVVEGYAWGQEWLLGTYKHPPLQAWILQIMSWPGLGQSWMHYLASQLCIVVAFWSVYDLGRRLFDETRAFAAVVLLEMVVYFNILSTEFNPNVLQLMLWPLLARQFYVCLHDKRLWQWLLLGVIAGASLYSKYFTIVILSALGFGMLVRHNWRKLLLTPGPYITLVTASLVFLPHVIWLYNHNFLPFVYTQSRLAVAPEGPALLHRIMEPVSFILNQIAILSPFILIVLFNWRKRSPARLKPDDIFFLQLMLIYPLAFIVVVSLALNWQLRDMWGMPFWGLIGLGVISQGLGTSRRILVISATLGLVILPLVFAGMTIFHDRYSVISKASQFPGKQLGFEITERWHQLYEQPLSYVVSDTWIGGNVSYYSPERPSVVTDGNFDVALWTTKDDVLEKGAVVVWCLSGCHRKNSYPDEWTPVGMLSSFKADTVQVQPPFDLTAQTKRLKPIRIGWAVIAPAQ